MLSMPIRFELLAPTQSVIAVQCAGVVPVACVPSVSAADVGPRVNEVCGDFAELDACDEAAAEDGGVVPRRVRGRGDRGDVGARVGAGEGSEGGVEAPTPIAAEHSGGGVELVTSGTIVGAGVVAGRRYRGGSAAQGGAVDTRGDDPRRARAEPRERNKPKKEKVDAWEALPNRVERVQSAEWGVTQRANAALSAVTA